MEADFTLTTALQVFGLLVSGTDKITKYVRNVKSFPAQSGSSVFFVKILREFSMFLFLEILFGESKIQQ